MNSITVTTAILAIFLSSASHASGSVQATDDWHENQLLNPSTYQLKAEQRGRVATKTKKFLLRSKLVMSEELPQHAPFVVHDEWVL